MLSRFGDLIGVVKCLSLSLAVKSIHPLSKFKPHPLETLYCLITFLKINICVVICTVFKMHYETHIETDEFNSPPVFQLTIKMQMQ